MDFQTDEIPPGLISRFGLFLARFCVAAWVGAATLFVIVGIREVTRAGFDSATKDILVAVRFPAFYACGSVLLSLGLVGAGLASHVRLLPKLRRRFVLLLLLMALITMAVDYVWVYQPLLAMVTPPGEAKTALFQTYHEASKWINLAGLTLGLLASTMLNWPAATASPSQASARS